MTTPEWEPLKAASSRITELINENRDPGKHPAVLRELRDQCAILTREDVAEDKCAYLLVWAETFYDAKRGSAHQFQIAYDSMKRDAFSIEMILAKIQPNATN